MFCNYENVTDYCCNKYSYRYYKLAYNYTGFHILSNYNDPVIRIDNDNGSEILLTELSNDIIYNCDSNDTEDSILSWDCYQIYRNICNKNIDDPTLADYINYQNNNILSIYYDTLSNGYLVTIKDFIISSSNNSGSGSGSEASSTETTSFSIRLKARYQDQIYYGNIMTIANSIYISNSDEELPHIIDFYDKAHKFSYQNIVKILSTYFNGLKRLQIVMNDNINRLSRSNSIDSVINTDLYQNKPSEKISNASDLVTEVLLVNKSTGAQVKNLNTPVFCNDNVDCPEGQTCIEGICT
jgi:hypothetical protein